MRGDKVQAFAELVADLLDDARGSFTDPVDAGRCCIDIEEYNDVQPPRWIAKVGKQEYCPAPRGAVYRGPRLSKFYEVAMTDGDLRTLLAWTKARAEDERKMQEARSRGSVLG